MNRIAKPAFEKGEVGSCWACCVSARAGHPCYNHDVGSTSSFVAFAVCLSILSGSIGAAFGRRYCGCDALVLPHDRRGSSLGESDAEMVRPATPALSGDAMVREAASTASDGDAKQSSRIAELEAEVSRLQSELGTTRFASMLVAAAPPDPPLGIAQAMRLLDDSYLTESPELRTAFVQEVRHDAALDLLQAEPRFRSALAAARRASSYEWPARREQLVQDFVLRLVDAGLSGRTIAHYRAALADYLDG